MYLEVGDHCCSSTARTAGNLGFRTVVVDDAMATFDRAHPDGEVIPAEAVHRAAIASLSGEFAEVASTASAIAAVRAAGR